MFSQDAGESYHSSNIRFVQNTRSCPGGRWRDGRPRIFPAIKHEYICSAFRNSHPAQVKATPLNSLFCLRQATYQKILFKILLDTSAVTRQPSLLKQKSFARCFTANKAGYLVS